MSEQLAKFSEHAHDLMRHYPIHNLEIKESIDRMGIPQYAIYYESEPVISEASRHLTFGFLAGVEMALRNMIRTA